ncbi:hypothetical protein [Spongiibacter sp. IMCC21906]|uniref:hypothetical protein n=1 Tax=Spongiibacter sp. IMCC21906 TaxID=1620392 RepID=UPI0018CEBAA7|nr:hypothetical protein [Spongiibacter sp. IMCC21906]
MVSWLAIALCIYIFFVSNNIYALLFAPILWFAGRFGELALLPMQSITEQESVANRKFGNWFILCLAILVIAGITVGNL